MCSKEEASQAAEIVKPPDWEGYVDVWSIIVGYVVDMAILFLSLHYAFSHHLLHAWPSEPLGQLDWLIILIAVSFALRQIQKKLRARSDAYYTARNIEFTKHMEHRIGAEELRKKEVENCHLCRAAKNRPVG